MNMDDLGVPHDLGNLLLPSLNVAIEHDHLWLIYLL